MALVLQSQWPLSGTAMRTDDIHLDRRQWLFWSDFLTCQVSLWAVSCFGHRRGLLMSEVGHFHLFIVLNSPSYL